VVTATTSSSRWWPPPRPGSGDLAAALRRQRVHLLTELRSLAEAGAAAAGSPVVALLVKAAELHVRADLGVVDAAEHDLTPDVLAALRLPAAPAATLDTRSSSA
jgi:hypothetical protein